MGYDIQLRLGEGWKIHVENIKDDAGMDMTHLEAAGRNGAFVDITIGAMPDGENAQDQAFANYVETVGFSDDDPEGFNPIARLMLDGKAAWGFDAYCEDDAPMRLITQEIRSGVLAIIVFSAPDRDSLVELHRQIEHTLRVRK